MDVSGDAIFTLNACTAAWKYIKGFEEALLDACTQSVHI